MYKSAKHAVRFFTLLTLLFCHSSCEQKAADTGAESEYIYSIYVLGKDGKEFITEVPALDTGVLYPEKEGTEVDMKTIDRDIIVKDGFYYRLNWKNSLFTKYKISEHQLVKVAAVEVRGFSIENFKWIGGDTLLLTGLQTPGFDKAKYIRMKTGNLSIIDKGDIEIPAASGRFSSMSIGFAERQGKRLLVGYTYHQQLGSSNYTTSDTTYTTTLNYPEMKVVHTDKDTRSTYPAGINTVQSYTFYDEQEDFYFMTCPGIALGNRPDLPTAIFRIKKGANGTDKNYFFNISGSAIQNHAYGLWYLGNGKAIIRSERKDLYKGLGDHYSTAHFEFYLLDLQTKAVQKLGLPLDKGTRRECVIVSKDVAYIAVNSTKEGNYIWVYDIKTGALKKGMQLVGDTDFIMRIDRLR